MKYKKQLLYLALPLLLISSFFVYIFFFSKPANESKEDTKTEVIGQTTSPNDEEVLHPSLDDEATQQENIKMSIYVIGDKKFPSSHNVNVIHSKITDDFSEHRFILLPISFEPTYDQQKILYDWILEGKTVAYYGHDLDSSLIPDKLNLPIEYAGKPLGTNINFVFLFYGYGYSIKNDTFTPIFHLVQDSYPTELGTMYDVLHQFLIDKNDF